MKQAIVQGRASERPQGRLQLNTAAEPGEGPFEEDDKGGALRITVDGFDPPDSGTEAEMV